MSDASDVFQSRSDCARVKTQFSFYGSAVAIITLNKGVCSMSYIKKRNAREYFARKRKLKIVDRASVKVANDPKTFFSAPVGHDAVPFGQAPEVKAARHAEKKAVSEWLGRLSPRKKRQALQLLKHAAR
jgi:hypothetical protein